MGISSGANIQKMISGDRNIGKKIGYRIAEQITANGKFKTYFKKLVDLNNSSDIQEQEKLLGEILSLRRKYGTFKFTVHQEQLHSEWYHFVILELLTIPDIDQSAQSLATLLQPKIRPAQVAKSIDLLIKLGLVVYNSHTGRLETKQGQIKTGTEEEHLLLQRYHQEVLEISKKSITEVARNDRDISTSTFRITRDQIESFKRQIYDFQMQLLAQEVDPEIAEQVYQFNFQLIPVTKSIKEKEAVQHESEVKESA